MKAFQFFSLCFLTLVMACKDEPEAPLQAKETNISTFYLIRHAEKERTNPEDVDPELNQEGLGRAMHWAEILNEIPLDAIYSTDFNRTSMTAAPVSVKKNIDVQYYDPRILNLNQFKIDNLNKNVLVVGHSNTTPDLANKLLGEEKYGQLDDDENGTLFIVTIVNGVATSNKLVFNCNCPD
jgi:broad specificity phosphatase PhoE